MSELEKLRIFVKKELEDVYSEYPCDDNDSLVKATKICTYESILNKIDSIMQESDEQMSDDISKFYSRYQPRRHRLSPNAMSTGRSWKTGDLLP